METEIESIAIKYVTGTLSAEDILAFVNAQLEKGVWSETFLEIMDFDSQSYSGHIFALFEEYLRETLKEIPTMEEAVNALLYHHLSLIVAGKVNPYKEFGKLLLAIENYDYYNKTEHYVGDSLGIVHIYGWYHDDYSSPTQVENGILKESKIWLSSYAKNH
ncbi:MAG: hypothetical protein ACMZ63_08025 [Methylotenera sp.]